MGTWDLLHQQPYVLSISMLIQVGLDNKAISGLQLHPREKRQQKGKVYHCFNTRFWNFLSSLWIASKLSDNTEFSLGFDQVMNSWTLTIRLENKENIEDSDSFQFLNNWSNL